jgi:hypothetical protein
MRASVSACERTTVRVCDRVLMSVECALQLCVRQRCARQTFAMGVYGTFWRHVRQKFCNSHSCPGMAQAKCSSRNLPARSSVEAPRRRSCGSRRPLSANAVFATRFLLSLMCGCHALVRVCKCACGNAVIESVLHALCARVHLDSFGWSLRAVAMGA